MILIIEDDRTCREAMQSLLTAAGYRVVAVADGKQAYNVLRAGIVPHLILLDMLLPINDGWHFMERIRDNRFWSGIPVIMITGFVLTADWAVSLGCAGFLKKPIDIDRLLDEVERCVDPASCSRPRPESVHSLL